MQRKPSANRYTFFIYIFKRNSFLARKIKKYIYHEFKKPYQIYNYIFLIGNLSKKLDNYILLIINNLRLIKKSN